MTTPEREKFEKWVCDTYPGQNNVIMRKVLLENNAFSDTFTAGSQYRQPEIDALKAEVAIFRMQVKPVLPAWSPDYGSGPVTPDRIYQYFEDGAWYDCKKMDIGFYIADNTPVRELFTRPSIDAAMADKGE